MEYYTAIKREWNNAICSNMDGSREYYTQWSESDRERQIAYVITYTCNLKKWYSQSRFDAQYWVLGAGALGWPRGMVWGGRGEEGSGWGTDVYLWQIHFDILQNQYNIVKLNKIKLKK